MLLFSMLDLVIKKERHTLENGQRFVNVYTQC